MTASYDVIVIGSGPAGYVCAIRCAQLGKKVAVVEQWADDRQAGFGWHVFKRWLYSVKSTVR